VVALGQLADFAWQFCAEVLPLVTALGRQFPHLVPVVR
jgi:hypothetical protein